MRMKSNIYLLAGLALLALLVSGCAEKITAPPGSGLATISMKVDAVQESQSISKMFVYIILPEADSDHPLVDSLIELDGFFVGDIKVPAGLDRRFIVEGEGSWNERPPQLIYRGETVANVLPGITTRISIDLYPIVPMVKLVPRVIKVPFAATFGLDLVVYNLFLLDSAAIGVSYDIASLSVDSVVRNRSLGDGVVELDERNSTNNALTKIMVWHASPLGTIVNAGGYSTLVTIFLRTYPRADTLFSYDTTYFEVYPLAFSQFAGDSISTNDVYYEPAMIVMDFSFGLSVPGKAMSQPR